MDQKTERELESVTLMVEIYCKGNHHDTGGVCSDCQELITYAQKRTEHCPFKENKTFCSNCHVHCYRPEMREKIKQVMRYSGPRMLRHKPLLAIKHVISTKREKRKLSQEASGDK